MKKTVIGIIQVHMSSTRLPGKVMKDICGKPALYRMIERLRRSKTLDDLVLATSTKPCDDIIVEKAHEWGVHVFRGSDSDVLSRYYGAARQYPADFYVRLTSDNPLIDPGYMDELVNVIKEGKYRYVCPDSHVPNGLDCEAFTAELLQEDYENATESYEHEHVTPYMYWKQDSIYHVPFSEKDYSHLRFTLDTEQDYQVITHIYNALYTPGNTFDRYDIIKYLDEHPEVLEINKMIKQKPVIM